MVTSSYAKGVGLLAHSIEPFRGEVGVFDFAKAETFYERSGLLDDLTLEILAPAKSEVENTWNVLHASGSACSITVIAKSSAGEILGAISSVLAWESTWFVQHFAALPAGGPRLGFALMQAWFEETRPWASAEHLAFFVKAGNASMNAFSGPLLRGQDDPSVSRSELTNWSIPEDDLGARASAPHREISALREEDEPLVGVAALRAFGATIADALSLRPGSFALPETTPRFARLGLTRRRSPLVISDPAGTPCVALFHELTSPGVNLVSLLSAVWLVPLWGPLSDEEARMLPYALAPCGLGQERLLITSSSETRALVKAGFRKRHRAYLYAANRVGMERYYDYIRHRNRLAAARFERAAWKAVSR